MANVGTAAAGKTLIGAGNGVSPTFASIGTNSGLTTHGVVISEGNSAFVSISPSTAGFVLTSNGVGSDPSFQNISGTGVLLTLTPDSGGAISPTAGNINLFASSTLTGNTSGSGSTITFRSYTPANWIVDPIAGRGTHQTITAALASATSGDNIYIREGTYTENFTLKAGVNLLAINSGLTPTVTVIGKMSFAAAGTVTVNGIRLQTNSDNFLAVTGSAASIVNLTNCYLNCTNNTGISYTTSSTSAQINCTGCIGNLGTTGIALYSMTGNNQLTFTRCDFGNSGASTTPSNNSNGAASFLYCIVVGPVFTTSSTGLFIGEFTDFNASSINTSVFVASGTSTGSFESCTLSSGTASAVSVGAGCIAVIIGASSVNSSNANALTGAGTLKYSSISFVGTSGQSTVNVSTQTQYSQGPLLNIANGGTNASSFTTTGGIVIYDGTRLVTSTGTIGTFTDVTGATQTIAIGNSYACDRGGGVTFTLPATATAGDVFEIVGKLGLWTVAQNAGQQIGLGSSLTTAGVTGSLTATNVGDCAFFRCITGGASTIWRVTSSMGNITVA